MIDDETAYQLIADTEIIWYQKFKLSENVMTPGDRGIEWLLNKGGLPERLDGMNVLDIGTTNGGAAFIAEQRGAERVVAVDIVGPDHFGFAKIKNALGSNVEYIQSSIYELPGVLDEQFDFVLCLGVLYHLRHPLLALDSLRMLTGGLCLIETALSGDPSDPAIAAFHRLDGLSGDFSNWFSPTLKCMVDWLTSSGFTVERTECFPKDHPTRSLAVARPLPGDPEYARVSYEIPLKVLVSRKDTGINEF